MQSSSNNHVSKVSLAMSNLNYGAQMLQAERYHEAVDIFTNVMANVKALAIQDLQEGGVSKDYPVCFSSSEDKGQAIQFLHSREEECLPRSDDYEDCFVFQSPIVVDTSKVSQPPSVLTLSAIVVYNLALTYHLGAVATKPCESIFRRALHFYQLAHNIQQQSKDMDDDLSVLLSMAIANNIGHIHGFVGSLLKARQCFDHLLSTVMYVTDCRSASGDGEIPQADVFWRNIQRWVLEQRPAAAA